MRKMGFNIEKWKLFEPWTEPVIWSENRKIVGDGRRTEKKSHSNDNFPLVMASFKISKGVRYFT